MTVFTPGPGGGTSSTLTFTIHAPARLGITTTTPLADGTVSAAYSQTLQATGGATPYHWIEMIPAGGASGLPPGLTLTQAPGSNDAVLSGTPAQAGTFSFTIQVTDSANPATSDSRVFDLLVNNPVPVITQIAPDRATEGDASIQLAVDGTGFVPTSEVLWDGNLRPTTFVNATLLTADIPASDLAARGTAQVAVRNPAPGGGTSNAVTFTIDPPVVPPPGITSITPNSAMANSSGFPLQVNGLNFDSTSVVMWGGMALATDTSGAPGQLIATVQDADLAVASPPATVQVTVVNSPPGGGMLTSNAVDFTITAPPGPAPVGVLEQISVDSAGNPGNATSAPDGTPRTMSMSGDGRYVVFQSFANNLDTADTNGLSDVFLRDTCRGPSAPAGCQKSTTRLANPIVADGATDSPGISGDGQWIVYVASGIGPALHLVARPTAGGTPVTLVTAGSNISRSALYSPAFSRDGRHVAFVSKEELALPNLFAVDNVFVVDRDVDGNGIFDEPNSPGLQDRTRVSQVSVTLSGQFFGASTEVAINADGRFVAFTSSEFDLVVGDNNNSADIFLHDRDADGNGVFDEPGTTSIVRLSVDSNGAEASKAGSVANQRRPAISGDGRFVAFASDADNLLGTGVDTNNGDDIFVRDTCFGAPAGCAPSTSRVSLSQAGAEVTTFFQDAPAISSTGRFVAFCSSANDLVPMGNDLNPMADTFVRDTCFGAPAGCAPKTVIVSVPPGGHMVIGGGSRFQNAISEDGSLVVFNSDAQNFVLGMIVGSFTDLFLAGSGLHQSLPAPPPPAPQARLDASASRKP